MKWAYKAIYYDPNDEDPYTPEEKVNLSGAELTRAMELLLGPPLIEKDLNALGQEGWELVAIMPGNGSNDGRPWTVIFKRPT